MKIDEEAYTAGKRDYKRGVSVKDLVVATSPPEGQQAPDFDYAKAQAGAMSRLLGFADAFLEALRGSMRR